MLCISIAFLLFGTKSLFLEHTATGPVCWATSHSNRLFDGACKLVVARLTRNVHKNIIKSNIMQHFSIILSRGNPKNFFCAIRAAIIWSMEDSYVGSRYSYMGIGTNKYARWIFSFPLFRKVNSMAKLHKGGCIVYLWWHCTLESYT